MSNAEQENVDYFARAKNILSSGDAAFVEPTEVQNGIARAFPVLIAVAMIASIVVRVITWDYAVSRWILFFVIVPISVSALGFIFFVCGAIRTIARRSTQKIDASGLSFDILILAIRATSVGLVYSTFLLIFLFHFRFFFGEPLVQGLALLKLAATHFLYAAAYRSDWKVSLLQVTAGATYVALGITLYLCKEDDLFQASGYVLASAFVLFSGCAFALSEYGSTVGLLLISASYFGSAHEFGSIVCIPVFTVGSFILLHQVSGYLVHGTARMTALLFGSWSRIHAADSSENNVFEEKNEHEPLLSYRSDNFIVVKN